MKPGNAEKFIELFTAKEKKMRTSFHLIESTYREFARLCKERGIIPSDVVNFMIKDFLENHLKKKIGEDK